MEPLELPEGGEVDVCDACGGMWVDWFDGEVRKVAAETLRISSTDAKADQARDSNEPMAIGACPRDQRQLVPERYEMKADVQREDTDKTSIVVKPTGAELMRCEECMGSFVSRASAEVLSFLDSADDHRPSDTGASTAPPLPWERFVKVVKSMLGLKSVAPKPTQ
jgi:hypothetical protein